MNKVLMLSVMVWVMAASAETVLWYSFDEGDINEKTVSGGTIVNRASNGDMSAVPHALKNSKTPSEDNSLANWATYAEGFDADYHVYDPVSQTSVQTADRALDFNHSGGSILTVANDVRLRSQPMTVEAFVQFPQNAALTVWNVIAVQPAFMPCANADAWGFRFTNSEKLVARFTPLTFAGTSSGNAFKGWMDEARITMKALTEERFFTNKRMRADGDVRAHVTFDGTMAAEELGTVFVAKVNDGREPAYSDEVPAKYICDERGQEGCRLNAQSLRLDGGVVKFLGSPWLRSDEAQTIEFFVKGEAQDAYAPVVRFGCSDGDTAIPVWALSSSRANPTEFLMTRWDVVNGENRQADSCETSVTLFDGKWHHVALTFAPNAENSDRSDIAVWKDYEMVFSKTTDGRVAYDQAVGMLWLGYNGTKTFTGWIDELRITKGVIDSKKFLRAKNFSGVTIIIK